MSQDRSAPDLSNAELTASSVTTTTVGCAAVADVDPQELGITYEFDARPDGDPYPLTVRFAGRRTGVVGTPGPRDSFMVTETVDRVLPGSGRIALTRRVGDIAPGRWEVAAAPDGAGPSVFVTSAGSTVWGPAVRALAPGVRVGAWPALVVLGAIVAVVVQGLLAARLGLPGRPILLVSALACVLGVLGAKVYYLVEHRGRPRTLSRLAGGMCIQGFVLAAVGTVVLGAEALTIPTRALLDVTAPGLLFGMAIGRLGCFVGGCCAGRPTAGRGLWSSDRRTGVRRIPTQLFESAGALLVGLTGVAAVLAGPPSVPGVVFVGAVAAYTLLRQLLFPLRDLARHTGFGRTATAVVSALALGAAVVLGTGLIPAG